MMKNPVNDTVAADTTQKMRSRVHPVADSIRTTSAKCTILAAAMIRDTNTRGPLGKQAIALDRDMTEMYLLHMSPQYPRRKTPLNARFRLL